MELEENLADTVKDFQNLDLKEISWIGLVKWRKIG
jgi:hypothetical protein